MKACLLTTCASPFEAHMLQDILQNEGIQSFLGGEIMSNYPPCSGVNVFVDEKDLEKAAMLIRNKE